MYTPDVFALNDPTKIARIIRENPFGLLVTVAGGTPRASHLPFLFVPEAGPHGTLTCHMARANPQWKDFAELEVAGTEALAVFQGAHGYISPNWYGPGDAVPTWNYLAVHAYGRPVISEDQDKARAQQQQLVATFEAGSESPWSLDSQDDGYVRRMLRGIVTFEMPVSRLEAKAKLSQNKSEADRAGVIAALEAGDRPGDQDLARAMRAWEQSG
jgi:transcriptional regulator